MRLLLDTQIYLWYLADFRKLAKNAKSLIDDAETVFISAASIWEATVKSGMGKLQVEIAGLIAGIEASGFTQLPVTARHAAAVESLPHHHRDPFDRLLVAQALQEPARLLTADVTLRCYSDLVEVV